MQAISFPKALPFGLALSIAVCAHAKSAPAPASQSAGAANAAAASGDKAAAAALRRAEAAYQSGQLKDADAQLNRLLKQSPKSPAAEEAYVILTDIALRQGKAEAGLAQIARFRRAYGTSAYGARMAYYQGQAELRLGKNAEAARAFAAAAVAAPNAALYANASKGLWAIVDGGGLLTEEAEGVLEATERDPALRAGLLERLGDQYLREGRYTAARSAFQDWLDRYGKGDAAGRVKEKLRQAAEAPVQNRTILLMAPMTGEFSDIGKAVKEGAQLAIDESNAKGAGRIETRILDDQGNLITGIHRLRKAMREEPIDAVLGPAMSDVSAGVAIDLSARKSPVPMVTPTATTHGIAALGDGVFQLNVTTGTLGQRIALYATGCLKLKDFAIVAPESEYGYQLADAFQKTVERKGGSVVSVQYFQPGAQDLAPQFEEIRKVAGKMYIEKLKADGVPASELDFKAQQKIMSDSVLPLDGIFLAATNGEEAYTLASQAAFNKIRAQFLGSSGWNDRAMLHRSSTTAVQGAYFSVDFQENSKTDAYLAFSRAYTARWKRAPDKVAALSYDAARFLLQGMSAAPSQDQIIPSLKAIKSFNGVLGRIVFDEKYGANTNAAIYRVEKKGFKETETCPEAE